jgi:hypothetical protein
MRFGKNFRLKPKKPRKSRKKLCPRCCPSVGQGATLGVSAKRRYDWEVKMEVKLNHFEKMIQEAAKCNDVEAQRLYAHSEEWSDINWSEVTTDELKRDIIVWMWEIKSGAFN